MLELLREPHSKICPKIGFAQFVESEKKTLNRTKDKTKRERII